MKALWAGLRFSIQSQPRPPRCSLIVPLSATLALQLGSVAILAGPATQTHKAAQVTLGAPTARTQPPTQPAKAATQQPVSGSGTAPATVATAGLVDTGVSVLGASIFSTGTENIILKILTPAELPYPSERITTIVNGLRVSLPNPNVSAYVDEIAIVVPGPARALATNKQYDRTINLGRLPAGEIIFAIRT